MQASTAFYRLRPFVENDRAYIEDSWVNTDQKAREKKGGGSYIVNQKALIRRIISRPTTEVRVACDVEDDDAIRGYAVVEPLVQIPRVYYVYVRSTAMKLGIGTALLRDLLSKRLVVYTHRPYRDLLTDLHQARKIPRSWMFNDFANHYDAPLTRTLLGYPSMKEDA